MPFVTADDGAQIFYKDWGSGGSPVILSHGWPLNADAWDAAARFLAEHGHRVDRPRPPRSRPLHARRGTATRWTPTPTTSPASSTALDLTDLTLVGHSTGGGEIVRYVGRHGSERVANSCSSRRCRRSCCRPTTTPRACRSRSSTSIRAGEAADRSQLYRDLADGPFFGHNRNSDVDQGFRDAFWLQGMACGHRAAYECIAAFSATDFRPDLAKVDVPTLVIHGDDDQIVPFEVGGKRSAELIDGAVLTVYEGSGHALPDTDRDRLHADLLEFINS